MQENNTKLIKIHQKITNLKAHFNHIRTIQLAYYHQLLFEGVDTRKDGLIWIIKGIWLLGHTVKLQKMPAFLDKDAIEFLLKYAKLDMEADELIKELRTKANVVQEEKERELVRKKTALLTRLSTQKLPRIEPENENDFGKINVHDRELIDVEKKLEVLKKRIKELKQAEIARIEKEFAQNNYEKKYGVPKKFVLTVLVGEEAAKLECEKQEKIKKMKLQTLSPTFAFGSQEISKMAQTTATVFKYAH